MERLQCKACGCFSMMPMDVEAEDLDEEKSILGSDQESRFYTCHVCGDNWLSVRMTESTGDTRITFVHQMGMQPTLKRIAQMSTPVVLSEGTVEQWDYFVGDDSVEEDEWRQVLDRRRFVLRSICTN
jgi:hypothetical protein